MEISHVYAFIGGTFVGKFAGFIPSVIVSGALLYTADPALFSTHSLSHIRQVIGEIISK